MEIFGVAEGHGDMKGAITAKLPEHHGFIENYLKKKDLHRAGERVVRISVDSGEKTGHREENEPIGVLVYTYNSNGDNDKYQAAVASEEPIRLRKIELKMHPNDFLSLFKRVRFSLALSGIPEGKKFFLED